MTQGMKRVWIGAVVALAAFSYAFQAREIHIAVGSEAPVVSGQATDGKQYSTDSLTKKGSVFLLFWKEVCPHNPRSAPMFNELAKAYSGKVTFLGVVGASPEGAANFAKQFALTYPLLPDGEFKAIRDYKLRYSITTVEIGKDGKVANVFGGYGQEAMQALNSAMAKAAGVEPASVDFSRAPGRPTYG